MLTKNYYINLFKGNIIKDTFAAFCIAHDILTSRLFSENGINLVAIFREYFYKNNNISGTKPKF